MAWAFHSGFSELEKEYMDRFPQQGEQEFPLAGKVKQVKSWIYLLVLGEGPLVAQTLEKMCLVDVCEIASMYSSLTYENGHFM
jgi:hypothetical protein